MPLYDLDGNDLDPANSSIFMSPNWQGAFSALSALGDMAMPSRLPVPTGAVLAKAVGAYGQGGQSAYANQISAAQARMLQQQLQGMKRMQDTLYGGGSGSNASPSRMAMPSAPVSAPMPAAGPGNAMPMAPFSPEARARFAQQVAALPQNQPASAGAAPPSSATAAAPGAPAQTGGAPIVDPSVAARLAMIGAAYGDKNYGSWLDFAKAAPGYQYTQNGTQRFVQGGPADPAQVANLKWAEVPPALAQKGYRYNADGSMGFVPGSEADPAVIGAQANVKDQNTTKEVRAGTALVKNGTMTYEQPVLTEGTDAQGVPYREFRYPSGITVRSGPNGSTVASGVSGSAGAPTGAPPANGGAAAQPSAPSAPSAGRFAPIVQQAEQDYGLPSGFLGKLLDDEGSGSNAVSPKGATGIGQFMPDTAKQYNIDPTKPTDSIVGMARFGRDLLQRYGGNQVLAAAAYNWGPTNVDAWLKSGADPSRLPAETQRYVQRFLPQQNAPQAPAASPAPNAAAAPNGVPGAPTAAPSVNGVNEQGLQRWQTGLSPMAESAAKERGTSLEKYGAGLQDDAENAVRNNFLVDQMRRESQSWGMGKFADVEGEARAYLQGFARNFGISTPQLDQKVADFQTFNKNAMEMSREVVRATSSRAAFQEMKMIQEALPQSEMSQPAFSQIADQLQGVNDFEIAKQAAADRWRARQGGDGTLAGFETDWNKNIGPAAFLVHRMQPTDLQAMAANLQKTPDGRAALAHIKTQMQYADASGLFGAQ